MTLTVEVTENLAACLALRRIIFIGEQGVPEALELDGHDAEAVHLLATLDGQPVGTARLFIIGSTGKIGRVCVLSTYRGTGLGVALINAAITHFKSHDGVQIAKLSAQTNALEFYVKLGFIAHGQVYQEAGIEHQDMTRAL
jgi:predicted GNAT family N-acyltransferase